MQRLRRAELQERQRSRSPAKTRAPRQPRVLGPPGPGPWGEAVPASANPLLNAWLFDWAWGAISAPRVRDYCRAAIEGGLRAPLLSSIARTKSISEGNCHRQLINLFCKDNEFKMVDCIEGSQVDAIVLPHKFFSAFHRSYPEQFCRQMGANPWKLEQFWAQLRDSDYGQEVFDEHPHLHNRDLRYVIPIITHVDAGPYSKRSSVKLFQWGPLLSRGNDYETRFVSFSWLTKDTSREDLPNKAWDAFIDSLNVLQRGCTDDGMALAPAGDGSGPISNNASLTLT